MNILVNYSTAFHIIKLKSCTVYICNLNDVINFKILKNLYFFFIKISLKSTTKRTLTIYNKHNTNKAPNSYRPERVSLVKKNSPRYTFGRRTKLHFEKGTPGKHTKIKPLNPLSIKNA